MKDSELEALVKVLVPIVREATEKAVNARVAPLESRIAAFEAKPFVKFCGTWKTDTTYVPGDAVVRDGGLWICKAETPGDPNKDWVGWQLAVRKGDAR